MPRTTPAARRRPPVPPAALAALAALAIASRAIAAGPLWVAGEPALKHAKENAPAASAEKTGEASFRILPPPGAGAGRNPFSFSYEMPFAVEKGERFLVECDMRAVEAEKCAGGQAGLVLSLLGPPGRDGKEPRPFFQHILLVGPEWEHFRIPVQAPSDLPAGGWRLRMAQSFFEQGIEFRSLRVVAAEDGSGALVGASYEGQDAGAAWRDEAARKIEKYRKADIKIRVTDELGAPLPGASISLEQRRHAYLFGTCVAASRITDAEVASRDPLMTREQFLADNARYREEIPKLFNFAVFENDLKWPQWAGENPNFTQRATMDAYAWLRSQRLAIKGHTMVWASWRQTPGWLRAYEGDPGVLQQIILRHIADIGAATGWMSRYWDVLNEPMSHRDIIELLGEDAVAEWFKAARAAMPGTRLVINDFDIVGNGGNDKRRADFIALIEALQKRGAPIDVAGFQGHFWSDRFTAPERIWQIIDDVHGKTGLPLMVSEFDTNFPNEKLQADYTRDFLTAWFAHPATEAFIMWGFWGGAHWFGEAGAMFRNDWSPKPNLAAYTDLVFRDWWTKGEAVSGGGGEAAFRAFLGEHRIEVRMPGRTTAVRDIWLDKGGVELTVVMNPQVPEEPAQ